MLLTIIECVATAVASLAAVISTWLAYKNIQETNINCKADRERMKKQEWYQQLVLVRLIPELDEFVAASNVSLEQCKGAGAGLEENLKKSFEAIKRQKRHLESNMQSIKIFDVALQKQCFRYLEELFDLYSQTINKALEQKWLGYLDFSTMITKKVEITEMLYLRYMKF